MQEGEHGYQSRVGTEGDERSRTYLEDEQQRNSSIPEPVSADAASPNVEGDSCVGTMLEAAPAQQPIRLTASSAQHDSGRAPRGVQATCSRSLLGQPESAAYHASACAEGAQTSAPAPVVAQGIRASFLDQSLAHSMQPAAQGVSINGEHRDDKQAYQEEAEDTESDDDIQVRPMNREALLRSLMGSGVAEDAVESFVASLKY